ncbi:hypothetical protein OROMI_006898 [Orobanche minor]
MGSQHTTARLDSAILGSDDGCSGRGGSTGSSRPRCRSDDGSSSKRIAHGD